MAETGKGSGITVGGFKDREQLGAWLEDQPREVVIAIAWRSAARAFPLLAGEKPDAVVLPTLRAIAVSRFAAIWPNHETEKVQSAALSALSDSAALSAADSAAYSASRSGRPFRLRRPFRLPFRLPFRRRFRLPFRRPFRRQFRRHLGPSHQ
jgi:hypothetical protein